MSHAKTSKTAPGAGELSRVETAAAVSECLDRPGTWKIETVGSDSGNDELVATFGGPHAKDRAVEYAFAKFAAVLFDQSAGRAAEACR
jgi:hypothetical protein